MSEVSNEMRSRGVSRDQQFREQMEQILVKLRNNPGDITTEDARRLSENYDARDDKSARIISAVEAFAVANEALYEQDASMGQAPHMSLLTVVNDLCAAVDTNPHDVTTEVLRNTESIVSKMQKAVGPTNAPHPEAEGELQEATAKIQHSIARGMVTKAEADYLHSLEARAHGHTEKGGDTSTAQSIAAKLERQLSLSSEFSLTQEHSRATGRSYSASHEQAHHEHDDILGLTDVVPDHKFGQGSIVHPDADKLRTKEICATDKSGLVATTQSMASERRQGSLSDRSNISPRVSEMDQVRREEMSHHDKDPDFKMVRLAGDPNIPSKPEKYGPSP